MKNIVIIAVCIGFLGIKSIAFAQNPIHKAFEIVKVQETALLKNTTPAGQEQFEKIRTAHITLRTVEDVQASLDRAIKNYSKHNKDQAFAFQNAFQSWKNAVLPVVRQGQNRLDKMVLTQTFTKPTDVQKYLTNYTTAMVAQRKEIQEIPVSDLKACQAMVGQLKETQETMGAIIKETIGLDDTPS